MSNKLKLNTKDESLKEILSNGKLYFVPKFQRDYSWENEHLEILWEDMNGLEANDYHYMGYLVLQEEGRNTFKIIDGQQRLTTFSLMVLAAIKRLREIQEDERAQVLYHSYIGTKNIETLELKNKLILNRSNDYYYRETVDGRDFSSRAKKRTVQLMKGAFEYFYQKFKEFKQDFLKISSLIEKVSSDLLFTTIYIGDDLSAYKVFETLNARGVQLSSADLLKNYLFACVDTEGDIPDTVLTDLEERWDKIGSDLREKRYTDYILTEWNSRNRFTRHKELFKEIRNSIKGKQQANNYLIYLSEHSELYSALNDGDNEFWKDNPNCTSIKQDLNCLKLFNIKQPISLLFISYIKQKDNFSKILRWITIFSIRYNVIGREHAVEQESVYNKMCLKIEGGCTLVDIKNTIMTLYPNDDTFKNNFANKTIPTLQSNKKARYLLARLAEHNSRESINETLLTIEHILPLNPSPQWINSFGDNWESFKHKLGNMALVTPQENKDLGQKSFEDKKSILHDTYSINNVDDYIEWSSQAVESRQAHLAKIATDLWKIS